MRVEKARNTIGQHPLGIYDSPLVHDARALNIPRATEWKGHLGTTNSFQLDRTRIHSLFRSRKRTSKRRVDNLSVSVVFGSYVFIEWPERGVGRTIQYQVSDLVHYFIYPTSHFFIASGRTGPLQFPRSWIQCDPISLDKPMYRNRAFVRG